MIFIPQLENEPPSYPNVIKKEILADKSDLQPEMERARQSGRIQNTPADKPRHISVKIIYRPERQAVMQQGQETLSKCGIFILQDLPAAEVAKPKNIQSRQETRVS